MLTDCAKHGRFGVGIIVDTLFIMDEYYMEGATQTVVSGPGGLVKVRTDTHDNVVNIYE